ncbi:hypothetical protein ACHAWO_013833 [Cyclotella atomus]|uniref:SMP-30/Gluconolactonase/LRE-like region domain-containing protein n=1 Tax=Cyclotella atomus TaxID=382360 RepID=A0ABD3QK64_9STRA
MKVAPFVLTSFLLRFTSVSSLSLRAGDKTVTVGEEHILTYDLASHESSTAGLVRGRKLVDGKEYTTDTDFDRGISVNVNHDDTNDQLQLDSEATPFNFIWIPISNLNLVVKVDTDTGDILGTYRTAPAGASGDPSRTTVDRDGSVWVANRAANPGTIVHIGLKENNQCQDRNSNPGIQTSNGTDPLGWTTTGLTGGDPGVGNAEDECIVHYTKVSSCGTRHLSIDAANNVWVSGIGCGRRWDLVKGGRFDTNQSGTIIRSRSGFGYGGYGGLTDPSGIIWSASPLLRWNPDPAPGAALNTYDHDSYGLCIDSQGNVWNTALYGNAIRKFNSGGVEIGTYPHGYNNAQGCVVDRNDDVWVAHSLISMSINSVGHLKNDGTHVGNVIVGSGPTGVSVDRNGKIWSANYYDGTLSRIDPNGGAAG